MARQSQIVSIKIKASQIRAVRAELGELRGRIRQVFRTAINKTLRDAQSAVATEMSRIINVGRNNIRKRMKVKKAAKSSGFLAGSMSIMARKIGLINFGARDTRPKRLRASREPGSGRGVTAKIFRGGPSIRLPHAFIARGNQGNKHVFERAKLQLTVGGITTSGVRSKRLPLYRIQGVSLRDIFQVRTELDKMTRKTIREKLAKYIQSQISWIMSKYKKPVNDAA